MIGNLARDVFVNVNCKSAWAELEETQRWLNDRRQSQNLHVYISKRQFAKTSRAELRFVNLRRKNVIDLFELIKHMKHNTPSTY